MIHLFRHGQVDGDPALYGSTDILLSKPGQESLLLATRELPEPDLIITSPLQRCHSFASAQAQHLGCSLKVEDDLREMNFGQWDGVPYREDSPLWPAMLDFWQQPATVTPPGGESLQQMRRRVVSAWYTCCSAHKGTTWIFAHGGVIRLILAELLDLDWRNPLLYSVLQVGYASRTDIHRQCFDDKIMTRVQAIAIPVPSNTQPFSLPVDNNNAKGS